jgi:hypothetical protein
MNRQVIYYHGHRYTRSHYRSYENNRRVSIVEMRRHDSPRWQDARCIGVHKHYGPPERLRPSDAGCYVDGHWGIYGIAHMVQRAEEFGYPDAEVIDLADRHLASMGPSPEPGLSDDEYWALSEASDEVENWLNDNIAPEGYSFGWWEGEFFLWSEEQWEE